MLFVVMFIQIKLNYINLKILMFTYMYAIFPKKSDIDKKKSTNICSYRKNVVSLHSEYA